MHPAIPSFGGLFEALLRASGQAAVLIALLLLAQWIGRGKMSAAWRHGLWLLVLARLALPWSVESPSSIFNWVRFHPTERNAPGRVQPGAAGPQASLDVSSWTAPPAAGKPRVAPAPPIYLPVGATTLTLRTRGDEVELVSAESAGGRHAAGPGFPATSWWSWLGWTWLAGVVGVGMKVARDSFRLWRTITPVRLVTDSEVLALLEDCKQLMGVRTPLAVVETAEAPSPVLYGFLRPRLLLPEGLLAGFSREELRYVFLHELAHVKRRDIAVSWLMTLLQVLHWFNPLVWIAFARMRVERELACDALALSYARDHENKSYGQAILRLLEKYCQPRRTPALAGLLEDPAEMKQRILGIAGFRRRAPSPLPALLLLLVLAGTALTDGRPAWTSAGSFRVPGAAIHFRAEDGADLAGALAAGEVVVRPGGEWDQAQAEGLSKVGEVGGLALDRWLPMSLASPPRPRVGHTTIWTGREMIVWGGGENSFFNDGGRLEPVSNCWRPVSTHHAPSARWHHAAIWTGREMLVWGGRADFHSTNLCLDGGCYDPVKDMWRPISLRGAPSPRADVTSAWTGREWLVWGGEAEGGHALADGARYDPERDTWTPLPPVPMEGRSGASGVWTGREFIIWGGAHFIDGGRCFGDGARFDPSEGRWTLLPATSAPRARSGHTAIWTGEEMMVWGGRELPGQLHLNSGARFNPHSNVWAPLSLVNAPEPREFHLAVWTGSEMVVWGGATEPRTALDTGGRYDPVSDRWLGLTRRGVPRARMFWRGDSGVWTGRQLLLFGGYDPKDKDRNMASPYAWEPSHPVPLFRKTAAR